MEIRNISVIGLGKLGFPFAVCLANKGYNVIGVDIDRAKTSALEKGVSPFFEPDLNELLSVSKSRLKATDNYDAAISSCEASFILVATPSNRDGSFTNRYVLEACKKIGAAIRKKKGFHLIVVTSTVTPSSMDSQIRPMLELHSGKTCGSGFGLCYNPEFIALGSVVHDLYNPDFILIGESDVRSGDMLSSIYKKFCDRDVPISRMNFINAELTKLTLNTFVTTKISYANMLAELCEKLPGANVDTVTRALGLDSRIGSKYLRGAVGYGGPCFPRDNVALLHTSKDKGVKAELVKTVDAFNRRQTDRLGRIILSRLPSKGRAGILGLSYKPNTDVVERSQGILLADYLIRRRIPVVLHDPISNKNARRLLGAKALYASSINDCIVKADVLAIATPWEEFRQISPAYFKTARKRKVIIDCWRILNPNEFKDVADYIPLGVGKGKESRI